MRISRALAAVALIMALAAVGCTSHVAGTAQRDPAQPPLGVSEDGYGVVARH